MPGLLEELSTVVLCTGRMCIASASDIMNNMETVTCGPVMGLLYTTRWRISDSPESVFSQLCYSLTILGLWTPFDSDENRTLPRKMFTCARARLCLQYNLRKASPHHWKPADAPVWFHYLLCSRLLVFVLTLTVYFFFG